MGAMFWFSLPYRLGLPPTSLILGHYLLLAVSVFLSGWVVQNIRRQRFSIPSGVISFAFILLCSLSIHTAFLFPYLRNSLADAPACLLALIGVWLLFLSHQDNSKKVWLYAIAGLCLGMAAWIRAFYLYPLLITLGLWFTIKLYKKKMLWRELSLLTALLPILIQFIFTFQHTRQISYLDPETSSSWSMVHLDSPITGYDTILPFDYHTWYAPCHHYATLLEALKTADVASISCILTGRAAFYWGSYSPHAYLPPYEHKPQDFVREDFNPTKIKTSAALKNLQLDPPTSISITDENHHTITVLAQKLWKPDPQQTGSITQIIELKRGHTYTLLASLWSERDFHNIDLKIRDLNESKNLAHTGALVTPIDPTIDPNHSITKAIVDHNGLYEISITSEKIDAESLLARAAAEHNIKFNVGELYLWDVKFIETLHVEPSSRFWSWWFLLFNTLAIILFVYFIKLQIKDINLDLWIGTSFAGFSMASAFVIVPEQRFIIFPMIFIWVFALTALLMVRNQKKLIDSLPTT